MLVLSLSAAAFAGGGAGPSKDMLKGVITEIDPAARTAVFMKDGGHDPMTIPLAESADVEKLPLNRKVMLNMEHHGGQNALASVSVMFMNMDARKIVALIVVGLVGGLLSGFIGSGGAFVLTPAMMSLGAPGAVAVASNMCHKFPKAMVGAYKRWKYGQADVKLGLVMASTAIIGVQIGIRIQKFILGKWGSAGSNLYVSVAFVLILVLVGAYVFFDAWKLAKGGGATGTPKLALAMQRINIPPMMHFKTANIRISAWITIPVGLATGMLAATIAVGGFIGVPGMIYVMGASAMVASATELVVAFVMGMWGSVQWGLSGLIDIRLTLLILSASLIGVQLGALSVAARIAREEKSWIKVVAVVPRYEGDLELVGVSNIRETITGPGRKILEEASAAAGEIGVHILTDLEQGEPYEKIVHVAEEERCDLIVMGRRGAHSIERELMGGVTARVIGHTSRDVLVVPRGTEVRWDRILVAADGSSSSRAAVELAVELAAEHGSDLTALSVVYTNDEFLALAPSLVEELVEKGRASLGEVTRMASEKGVAVQPVVKEGEPYRAIPALAAEMPAGLIVMGSEGRKGLRKVLMGSVTERTIGYATCPVLVRHPQG